MTPRVASALAMTQAIQALLAQRLTDRADAARAVWTATCIAVAFMKFFYIHPHDARWLRRWLCSNLVCFLAIICFLMAVRFEAAVPLAAMNHQLGDRSELATVLHREPQRVLVPSRGPLAVAPEGWRRTDQGWEHVSTWPALPRSLGEIIAYQEDREPAWIQFVLAKLRDIPPLAFALIQIAAIAAIVNYAKRRE